MIIDDNCCILEVKNNTKNTKYLLLIGIINFLLLLILSYQIVKLYKLNKNGNISI